MDVGDFGGQITLTLTFVDTTTLTYTINNAVNGPGGSVLYYGLITSKEFTHIAFGDTEPLVDFFAFDDMTIGTKEQVQPIPEPATLSLLGTGLVGLLGVYRRRRKTR